MFSLRSLFGFLLSLCFLCSPALAQPANQPLRIGAREVLLDLLVHDKKGRPVRDLKPEEIEVYEDGVKQTLTAVRLVETEAPVPESVGKTALPGPPVDPTQPIHLVTMIFDNLDNSSRKLAREAALDFVTNGMRRNVLVAVYVIGNRFYVLQSFTSEKEKVRQAIEMATGRAETQYPDVSRKIAEQMEIVANAADFGPGPGAPAQAQAGVIGSQPAEVPSLAGGVAPTGAGRGGTGVDKAMAQITLSTLRAVETAMTEQSARASVFTFLHVAREQQRLTGRKTLLYFSTGLVVPPHLTDVMRTALSEANRANVSIYAIDARGLQIDVESERARIQLAQAIKASRDAMSDNPASISAGADSFKSAEIAESSLRQNKQGTLAELAEGTGGALIANTNDLRKPLRQIAEDLGSYYALSYAPSVQELDGKFRRLTVRLTRPEIKVQSRSGYFAVPAVDGRAVMGYELPMLAALNEGVSPDGFPFQAGVLRFAPGPPSEHVLLLRVPLAEITFMTDSLKKNYSTHFSVLAVVKNEGGEIVTRVSQDYPLRGKLERLESLKKGNFDFTKTFALAPGKYTLQAVVRDVESQKVSLRTLPLLVPDANPRLAIGSLTPVRRVETAGLSQNTQDQPLVTAGMRIIPNLGEPIDVGTEKTLGFYLTAYTKSPHPAQLRLEFLQGSEMRAQTVVDLPAPDEKGRLSFFFRLPAESFASGAYQVRGTVRQDGEEAAESTSLTLVNPHPTTKTVPAAPVVSAPTAAEATAEPAPSMPAPIATQGISDAVAAVTKFMASQTVTGAAAVNVPEVLREVEKNGALLHQQLLGFTYQLRKVRHVLDETGNATSEEFQDFEAYPVRGKHVLIKIAEAGKKLPDWAIEQERKMAGQELERAEIDNRVVPGYVTAAISGAYRGKAAGLVIDPLAFLHACDFFDPRIERLGQREMIVLDFVPRAADRLPLTTAFVSKLSGTLWIDAIDHVLVRLEAKNILPGVGKNGKPLPPGTAPKLVYQQMKLPGGEWFPSVIRMNAAGDASAFYGLNWDVVFEFREYRHFQTAGEEYKLTTPEKKPDQE